MSRADAEARAAHARAFLAAAVLVDEFGGDAGVTPASNTIGSLAVLSGIAAGDAICGISLKVRAAGENHAEAVKLLRTVAPNGPALAKLLERLLGAKSGTQYSPSFVSAADAKRLTTTASRLVEGMEGVLSGKGLK